MKLDRGYISPYFITNHKNQKCELENPLIIIHEKKISSINAVVKVLELVLQVSISLIRFTRFFFFTMNWLTNFCSFSEAKVFAFCYIFQNQSYKRKWFSPLLIENHLQL
ncbi:unnamed protein product [Prunus brigantina]